MLGKKRLFILSGTTSAQQALQRNLCSSQMMHSARCWLQHPNTIHNLNLLISWQVPPNGLVVYTGTIMTDDGKEKKVNIDFEPFKPINTSLYLCDNKFHTEALNELLESDNR